MLPIQLLSLSNFISKVKQPKQVSSTKVNKHKPNQLPSYGFGLSKVKRSNKTIKLKQNSKQPAFVRITTRLHLANEVRFHY
ncbi:MAG: hypothetical protein ACTS4V_01230 [Candidatus Hodgkinia cicadicola]